MEITTKIDASIRATVHRDDTGKVSCTIFATADYAPGRSTTAHVDVTDRGILDSLGAAMTKAAQIAQTELGAALQKSIYVSKDVADRHGELVHAK